MQAGCAHCVQTPPERPPPLRWTSVRWSLLGPGLGVRRLSPLNWREARVFSPVAVSVDLK